MYSVHTRLDVIFLIQPETNPLTDFPVHKFGPNSSLTVLLHLGKELGNDLKR